MNKQCFHCDLTIPKELDLGCDLFGKPRYFCCHGCLAIAQTLIDNKLTDFYRFREKTSNKPTPLIPQELQSLEALNNPSVIKQISQETPECRLIELGIEGITCAACGWLIEKRLSANPQIKKVSVNVSTHRATVTCSKEAPLSDLFKTVAELGYRAYPFSPDKREQSFESINRSYIKRLLVAGLGMMQVMTYALGIYIGKLQDISISHQWFLYLISAIVTTPVVFYSAMPFFQNAWKNLKAKHLSMNAPVSLAIISAYSASVYSLIFNGSVFYFDSVVMFTFFLLIGRYLEHRARYRSLLKQQNFRQLLPLSVPKKNRDQSLSHVNIHDIAVEDILVVYAGSTIPVDGMLLENPAEINESVITGEFIPVSKSIGDPLLSGSTNHSSSLVMQATKNLANSHIQQLINLQQQSEQMKPDRVNLTDQIAHWYVLILLLLTLAVGLYWWQEQSELMFPVVLSVLVISCPCALSLATPASFTAAASQLSDLGFMLRTETALSTLSKVSRVYCDKTGTLTMGRMQIAKVVCHSKQPSEQRSKQSTEKKYLQIAAQLETLSNHPVANAFSKIKYQFQQVEDLKESIGQGVCGKINGKNYRLGNQDFVSSSPINLFQLPLKENEIHLFLVSMHQHLATFILQDGLKPAAKSMVKELQALDIPITLLSGDSEFSVSNTASQLGINDFIFNASAQHKLKLIQQSQKKQQTVLMLGDGFNDVGALAAADVSISMDNATNLSKTSSDAVLVANDLTVITKAIKIARKTQQVVRQNLYWAVIYNLIAVPFAMAGWVPAWLAALGMSFSSLVVVLNALRLRKN